MPARISVKHRTTEPVWHPERRVSRIALPDKYRPWLFDQASLTQRLIQGCPGEFRVQLLDQRHRRPLLNEAMALGMRSRFHAVVRHVYLRCKETPWVFARTIIPLQTLTGAQRRLAHLQSRSLGATLFADPSMRRGEVEVARLTPDNKLFALATDKLERKPAEIWGRRSLYWLSDKPLLVCEFFLPTICEFDF